jgi:hypothetical protein
MFDLHKITNLDIYPASVCEANGVNYFLGRRDGQKFVGSVGEGGLVGQIVARVVNDRPIIAGPTSHINAEVIRSVLPWTAPQPLGLATSVGMGDRLGLAAPGHLRAIAGSGLLPVLAQQSIREMTRTRRSAEAVMDAATWGVFQVGYRGGFGSDGDHLQQFEGIDVTAAAGFTMFTIDPGMHVNNDADALAIPALLEACKKIDLQTLATTLADLQARYTASPISLHGGSKIKFDEQSLLRAVVKYGNAIAHTVKMYRHAQQVCTRPFELEVSVDETASPTTPGEHYFFANELRRLNVKWVSMAPRFIGRFEKGVDYIGDLEEFRKSFKSHVAVMKTVGPYKMSIHSGSDKFSIYPIIAELAGDLVHLKTAGTSWLEALRAVAKIDPGLFRGILDFARQRYDTDKASYHVSADLSKVKPADKTKDSALADLVDDFHVRQVLHVTFGSILTADDGEKFGKPLMAALRADEEVYYSVLEKHLGRHVKPFAK